MSEPTAGTGGADLGLAAARGTGVTLAGQGLRFLVQISSLVLLTRLLSPAEFGLVAMVTALLGAADIVRDFGLSSAAIQTSHLNDDERTNLFWVNLAVGVACTVVVAASAPLVVAIYDDHRLLDIVLALSWIFIASGAGTQFRAELSRNLRFGALATVDVVAQVLAITTAIVAALSGAGYWAIVLQQMVVVVVTLVLSVALCRWRPGLPRRQTSIRRFFRFGGGVLGTQIIAYATRNLDNVAIGAYWGPQPLGLYSRAYQLLMTPLNQINAPLTRVALPILARVQDDRVVYQRYLERAQLVGCYLTATVLAVSAGMADPLVALLFGPRWSAVAPLFSLLAIGGVFRAVGQIPYWIFLSRGLTGAQLRLYLVTRPLTIAVMLAGLPWGPTGVAVGCSVAYFLDWLIQLWWVGRVADLRTWPLFRKAAQSLLLVSAPAGALALLGSSFGGEAVLRLAAGSACAAAYLVLIALVVAPVRRDMDLVGRFARQTVRRRRPPVGV